MKQAINSAATQAPQMPVPAAPLPFSPASPKDWDTAKGWYFTGSLNGRPVYQEEDCSEETAIVQIMRQCPELNIQWNAGQFDEGTPYASSAFAESPSHDMVYHAGFWSINGVEMSESDLFDHLVELLGLGEEDAEHMAIPTALRAPNLTDTELAVKHGLTVTVTPHTTTVGEIKLGHNSLWYYGESSHLELSEAIEAMQNQCSFESASTFPEQVRAA